MKKKFSISLLPGDGIGQEITVEAKKILNWVDQNTDLDLDCFEELVGGSSIDKHQTPLHEKTLEKIKKSDAIILGAVGGPKWEKMAFELRPERGLLKIRKELDLFANFRPAIVFDSLINSSSLKPTIIKNLDLLIIRELTGGIYFGERGRKDNGNTAFDTCTYSRKEIERLAKKGFVLAMNRRKKLCCVDKANVLESSRLWRETVQAMEKDYPEIKVTYEFVDAVAMRLIQWPSSYDVLITSNLFGDILTDEASVISGSMGLMPSASIGSKNALYEPIHGSYPEATGKKIANPIASILSLSMMLDHSFNLKDESKIINRAVEDSLINKFTTPDLNNENEAYTTDEVGDYIVNFVKNN